MDMDVGEHGWIWTYVMDMMDMIDAGGHGWMRIGMHGYEGYDGYYGSLWIWMDMKEIDGYGRI